VPAVAAERGRDHDSGFTDALGDIHRPEPVRPYVVHRQVEIVAVLVQLHLLVLVVGGGRRFHNDPVVGVPVIPVVRFAAELAARLSL